MNVKKSGSNRDNKESNENKIAFRRVGGNAGNFVFDDISELSEQSHYFIKLNKNNTTILKNNLNNIKWNGNNTIGPKSISKQELIENLNNIFTSLKI